MQPDKSHDLDQRLSRLYAAPVPESFGTGWRADIRREERLQDMKTISKGTLSRVWKKAVPVLCMLVLVLGGLWTGHMDHGTQQITAYETGAVTSTRSASNSNSSGVSARYSLKSAEEASYDMAADMAAGDYDTGISTYGAAVQTDRKLVRTADLTIRTSAFDDALSQVQTNLTGLGGYIENLYQYGENIRRISLTLRVPAEKLDEFLESLSGTGKVTDRSESTTDMTAQYTDQQARLNTLYEKRERLNALLQKAESVEDLIEIENAIADTQYQIDSYETSQRSIDRQVDLAAVHLTLIEQEQTVVNPELSLGERIRAGFRDSVAWLSEFLRDTLVFAVMISPVIALGAVIWLVRVLIRKGINKRRNRA